MGHAAAFCLTIEFYKISQEGNLDTSSLGPSENWPF